MSGVCMTHSVATETIRILLIDDHALVRAGLRLLIETYPGFRVVGEAGNRVDAVNLAGRHQPDIILLDLAMTEGSAPDFLSDLVTSARQARVLLLTTVQDPAKHRRAVCQGAMGIVHKGKAPEVLIKAIQRVHAGEAWLDRSMTAGLINEMRRTGEPSSKVDPEAAKIAELTAREREIIARVGAGLKNKQIAQRLFISEPTVRHHMTSVFSKLGVTDRFELIIYSFRYHLAKLPSS